MNLRRATSDDAEVIAFLHAESWRRHYTNALSAAYLQQGVVVERQALWRRRLASPAGNQRALVAEDEGEVLGFACVFAGEHPEWGSLLDNLHVDQRSRGMGLGTTLLVEAARWCAEQVPGSGLYLSVNEDNEPAQRFYFRLGARSAGTGTWHAPDGSAVPIRWFAWSSLRPLLEEGAGRSSPGAADSQTSGMRGARC